MIKKSWENQRCGPPFNEKLIRLMKESHYTVNSGFPNAVKLARALYDDDVCFSLVCPKNKGIRAYSDMQKRKEIATIARTIERHIEPQKEAHTVAGNFILAYSIIFNCSLDYLYGRITDPVPNVEIGDICKKTGLSIKAVNKLLDDSMPKEVMHEVWSYLIESDFFEALSEDWFSYGGALLEVARDDGLIEAKTDPEVQEGMDESIREMQEKELHTLENHRYNSNLAARGVMFKIASDLSSLLTKLANKDGSIQELKSRTKQAHKEELQKLNAHLINPEDIVGMNEWLF